MRYKFEVIGKEKTFFTSDPVYIIDQLEHYIAEDNDEQILICIGNHGRFKAGDLTNVEKERQIILKHFRKFPRHYGKDNS